ncbi:LADA_0C00738g1_1 [Lachancea dasiensis]|uniref:LADA_0C00738g1_1 n=1 Tax=Lachancea dasiensis TaxID=1072105 RepID=A0A1G4IX92_9SACH|nr:LADA_0C00738g1_1 [Lachancea dasiensis]
MKENHEGSDWDLRIAKLVSWLKSSEYFRVNDNVFLQDTPESGRGLYLKADTVSKNDVVVSIPSEYQLNFHSVVYHISKFNADLYFERVTCSDNDRVEDGGDPRSKLYKILTTNVVSKLSSFQLLCLYIMFEWKLLPFLNGPVSFWKPFFDVFPAASELKSIPSSWVLLPESCNKALFESLPAASMIHAQRIADQVLTDWRTVSPVLQMWSNAIEERIRPTVNELFQHFVHTYFVINSRCLYIDVPLKKSIADNFTMVPFVDFLNHSSDSELYCTPRIEVLKRGVCGLGTFNIVGGNYKYSTVGEQILLNYGAHSNDFLLCEYGFTLKDNKWNYIDVSPEVERLIEEETTKRFLQENGFWGDYTISESDISFRTLVALAAASSSNVRKVEKFMLGYLTEDSFYPHLQTLLQEFLHSLLEGIAVKTRQLETPEFCDQECVNNILQIYNGYTNIIKNHLKDSVLAH